MLKRILSIMLFVTSLAACSKILDIDPEYQLEGTTRFKTLDDYEFALVGTYGLFQSTSYYGASDGRSNAFVTLPDLLSDNVNETGESLGNERVFSRWSYAEDEVQIEQTWLAAYKIISQANLVLKDIDKFSSTDGGAVHRIKAQALAIRAMVHFDVLRYWVEDYDRNSTKPGIPYITNFDYESKPGRATVKQTYDHIEADLMEAKQLMADMDKEINSGSSRAYMDSSVVNAILARMYLYSNQVDNAITHATYVIDAFPLAASTVFPKIWTDASNDEVVWSLVFDAGQGTPGTNIWFPQVNASSYRPNPTLLASYDPAADVRFNAYFDTIPDENGTPRIVLTKYAGKEAQQAAPDGNVNFKAFRTGEMYLIRAEAYARKGGAFEAMGLADLNTLRAARIAGYVPGTETGQALLNAIAKERRKELIAEGHRWFDLKRTTRTVNRDNCTSFCSLPADNRAWNWPIPKPEIDANPNILPQNPGY